MKFLAVLLSLFMTAQAAIAASVTLAWNPNSEPDIAGYKINYGFSSRNYTQRLDVGNTPNGTVSNLNNGTTYFFAATAYNTSGAESGFSNEVIYTAPGTPPPPTPTAPPTPTGTPSPFPTVSPVPTVSPTPNPNPGIAANPNPLNFTWVIGQTKPTPKIRITTSNGSSWTAHDVAVWVDVQPQSGGPSNTDLTVTPNDGLSVGTYTVDEQIMAAGLPDIFVRITLTVTNTAGSPTPSPTKTPSPIPTASPSPTKTPAPSPTASPSPTRTPTPTVSPTASPTVSPSPTKTPTPTASPTSSPTASPSPSRTPTPTASPSPFPTATITPTVSPTASPTISPSPSPIPLIKITGKVAICADISQNPVSNVTMTVTGDAATSTITDEIGDYLFNLSQGNYTITPSKTRIEPATGGIDTADIIAVQNHFLGFAPLVGCQLTAADANGDNTINTIDVVAIQRFYLGIPTGLANVGKHKFVPNNREYNLTQDQINQNFDTTIIGDVTKPFIQTSTQALRSTTTKMVAATVDTLSLPNISISPKSTNLVIPIKVSYVGSKSKIVGFQGDFTFDSSLITFETMPVQKAGLTAGNWTVAGNVMSSRGNLKTLRISAFANDLKPLISSGTLFELHISKIKKPSKIAKLIWKASPDNFVFIDISTDKQAPSTLNTGNINIKDE